MAEVRSWVLAKHKWRAVPETIGEDETAYCAFCDAVEWIEWAFPGRTIRFEDSTNFEMCPDCSNTGKWELSAWGRWRDLKRDPSFL